MFYQLLVLLLILNGSYPIKAQSLFDAVPAEDFQPNQKARVNLPPKFLSGGDMDNFSLPEDTPVGTIVSFGVSFHASFFFTEIYFSLC